MKGLIFLFSYIYKVIDKIKAKLNQKGQGMVEYAVIIAVVAGIAVAVLNGNLKESITQAFDTAGDKVKAAASGTASSGSSDSSSSDSTESAGGGGGN